MVEFKLPGSIFYPKAYDAAKRLDHSSWQKGDDRLPRRVTASDIDVTFTPISGAFTFDNQGKIIYCELTRYFANWNNVSRGQRWLYESCIRDGAHCAVICKHSVSPEEDRPIDTRHDIEAFQIMIYDCGFVSCQPYQGNENWQRFVRQWFSDPIWLRRYLLGRTIGKVELRK